MDWKRSKLKDAVDHLRGLVNEQLRCALDDSKAREVDIILRDVEMAAAALRDDRTGWDALARDPDDGALLSEERDRVVGLGIPEVDVLVGKFMLAQRQLKYATADNSPVAVAVSRDVLDIAKKNLDEELKKHMTPLEELRKEVIGG